MEKVNDLQPDNNVTVYAVRTGLYQLRFDLTATDETVIQVFTTYRLAIHVRVLAILACYFGTV